MFLLFLIIFLNPTGANSFTGIFSSESFLQGRQQWLIFLFCSSNALFYISLFFCFLFPVTLYLCQSFWLHVIFNCSVVTFDNLTTYHSSTVFLNNLYFSFYFAVYPPDLFAFFFFCPQTSLLINIANLFYLIHFWLY